MKALGYIRVSTGRQANYGLSLEAQEAAIKAYCERRGLELVEIVADRGISGRTILKRPGMRAIMERLDTKEFDALVVVKLDRMFRSAIDATKAFEVFRQHAISFHSINESWDTSTPQGKFAQQMMIAVAELESGLASERTKETLRVKTVKAPQNAAERYRKQTGKKLLGSPPYGYKYFRGRLVIDPLEMSVVRYIFALWNTGHTYATLRRKLFDEDIYPRRHKVTGNPYWERQSLRHILNAPWYDKEIYNAGLDDDENEAVEPDDAHTGGDSGLPAEEALA